MRSLNSLACGSFGTIDSIVADQSLHQRLLAMGFRTGKKIQLIRKGSFNGPLHFRIGSTDIIMRDSEAKLIQISQQ